MSSSPHLSTKHAAKSNSAAHAPLNMPTSPTDNIMSPCTRRLLNPGKKLAAKRLPSYDLNQEVDRRSCPADAHGMRLVLGTSSANRKMVADKLGWQYYQTSPDIDEKAIRSNDPLEMPILIAKAKAAATFEEVRSKSHSDSSFENAIILSLDQIVLFKETVREKPESAAEATAFLSSYSEDQVSTVSAVVVTHYPSGIQRANVDICSVYWSKISADVVARVVERGEIFTSAGGFRIEDEDLNPLIKYIDGSMASVMGFPVAVTEELMQDVIAEVATSTTTLGGSSPLDRK